MKFAHLAGLSAIVLFFAAVVMSLNKPRIDTLDFVSPTSDRLSVQGASIKRSHPSRSSDSRATTSPLESNTAKEVSRIDRLNALLATDPTEECLQKITELIETASPDELRSFTTTFDAAPPGSGLQHALTHYLRKWAETDPRAAVDYAYKSPDSSDLRMDAALEAVTLFAASDLNGALLYVREIQSLRQNAFVNQLAPVAVQYDPQRTRSWILSLSDDHQRQAATFAALQQLSDVNSIKAADWALSLMNESFMNDAAGSVCLMVAASDPARALAFVDYLPAGRARDQALEMIFARWHLVSPDAAANYYASLRRGHEKDLMEKAFYEMRTTSEGPAAQ